MGFMAESSPAQQAAEDVSKTPQEALRIYADAASFQNNAAYPLAIEEWEKLIKQFPSDSIIPKAQHYLGVCYLQLEKPKLEEAIESFRNALKDSELDVRQESLVNLGLALYRTGREPDAPDRERRLKEALLALRVYLRDYSDGGFADKALFYAGECEYLLGDNKQAASFYNDLVSKSAYEKSAIRPDALYAMGVNYEEMKQTGRAGDAYQQFLDEYPDNRLIPEVQVRQAEIYLTEKKPAEASDLLSQVIRSGKSTRPDYVLYRYGFALAQQGDFDKSSAAYKELSETYPKSPFAASSNLAAGQALMRDGKPDEAIKYFDQIIELQSDTAAEAAHWLSQIYLQKRDFDSAAKSARSALQWANKSESAPQLRMDLADALIEIPESRAEAKEVYGRIAVDFPENPLAPRALYNAAFTALQLGIPEQTRQLSSSFGKLYPKDVLAGDAAYLRAESLMQLGKLSESIDAFDSIIQKYDSNPGRPLWDMRLATARYLNEDYKTVLSTLGEKIDTLDNPTTKAEAYFLLGASNLRLEQNEKAVDALTKSFQTNSKWFKSDEVLLLLAEAYAASDQKPESKATLERLLRDFPSSRLKTQAELKLGELSSLTGDYADAIARFDRVINAPANSEIGENVRDYARYSKAFALTKIDEFESAAAILAPLAEPNRRDSIANESRLVLAVCYRQTGQLDDSARSIEQLLSNNPDATMRNSAEYELGLTRVEQQRWDAAANAFQNIIDRTPDYKLADKILYELGWAYKEMNQIEKSNSAFTRLADQFPDSTFAGEANYHVGQTNYSEERFDNAAKAYTVAFTKSSDAELKEKAIHKLAWSYFKQEDYAEASRYFGQQTNEFPNGSMALDGKFMQAECEFKSENYADALEAYSKVRKTLEQSGGQSDLPEDVQSLIYLHGGQSARELKRWSDAESWLSIIAENATPSRYRPEALYELAYCYQNQKKSDEALRLYNDVATEYRNDVAARSRFMMGEIYFANRDYAKAIPEFQRVMFGFGGENAPDQVKQWQARASMEAGRCA
jgi:TolA-binding protein